MTPTTDGGAGRNRTYCANKRVGYSHLNNHCSSTPFADKESYKFLFYLNVNLYCIQRGGTGVELNQRPLPCVSDAFPVML